MYHQVLIYSYNYILYQASEVLKDKLNLEPKYLRRRDAAAVTVPAFADLAFVELGWASMPFLKKAHADAILLELETCLHT